MKTHNPRALLRENRRLQSENATLRAEIERLKGQQEPVACCPIARTELFGLIAELKGGSNWLSGKYNVYSYNRAPKIAADVLSALADVGPYELIEQLKDAHAWKLEGFGHFKDVTMKQNNAPFKAAEVLEQLFHHAPPDLSAKVAELGEPYLLAVQEATQHYLRVTELTAKVAELQWVINHAAQMEQMDKARISELTEQVKAGRIAGATLQGSKWYGGQTWKFANSTECKHDKRATDPGCKGCPPAT